MDEDLVQYFAMVGGNAVVWALLYWHRGPLRGVMHAWLARNPERTAMLKVNYPGEAEPDVYWTFWMTVALHHGGGAIIALIGTITQSVFIFRLGISFEIGEDFLHYVQMIMGIISPPGPEFTAKIVPHWSHKLGTAFHHSIGAFGGTFLFLTIPDWWEGQFLTVLLLGSAVPQLFPYPFMPFVALYGNDVTCAGIVAAWVSILGTIAAWVARLVFFPWFATLLLIRLVPAYGVGAAVALGSVACLFMVFVVASIALTWQDVKKAFSQLCGTRQEAKSELPHEATRGNLLSAVQASGLQKPKTFIGRNGVTDATAENNARELEIAQSFTT